MTNGQEKEDPSENTAHCDCEGNQPTHFEGTEGNSQPDSPDSASTGKEEPDSMRRRYRRCNGHAVIYPEHDDPGDNGVVDTIWGTIKSIILDMFPFLCSMEVFKNSLYMTNRSIQNSPCTSIFYTLITLFGVLPILCFILTVFAVFLLGVVWFVFSQVTMFCIVATIFGGFLFFIVASSFCIASSFGVIIQTFYVWRWMRRYLADHWRDLFLGILELGGKPGNWLREQVEAYSDQ